jgi:hypothetical protein
MYILADEFTRQASMEADLDIPSALMAVPNKEAHALNKAQLGFMNMFAIPLFQGVTDILPAMQYTVDELDDNRGLFEAKIREAGLLEPLALSAQHDATPSPRTRSIVAGGSSRPASQDHSASSDTVTPAKEGGGGGGTNRFSGGDDEARASSSSNAQRRSETTDGGASGPYSGEWASQATSATTGQMPLSPSTQNTSIVSRESLEQQRTPPPHHLGVPDGGEYFQGLSSRPMSRSDEHHLGGGGGGDGSVSPGGRRLLKKKSSRFLNAFSLFKRRGPASPSLPTADAAGS